MITIDTVDLSRLNGRLDELAATMGGDEVASALMAGAFVLEGEAKQNVQRMKAIDTSFMYNSIYSTGGKESGYAEARSAAKASNPDGEMFPEFKPGKESAAVCVGAEYARHVEFGTVRMTARPFMRQAVEMHGGDAVDAIGDAIERKMERIFR